jgi:hypothetical protein
VNAVFHRPYSHPRPPCGTRSWPLLRDGEKRFHQALEARKVTKDEQTIIDSGSWSVGLVIHPPRGGRLPEKSFDQPSPQLTRDTAAGRYGSIRLGSVTRAQGQRLKIRHGKHSSFPWRAGLSTSIFFRLIRRESSTFGEIWKMMFLTELNVIHCWTQSSSFFA